MKYPELKNTPIKETIFSISYDEIVNKDCFDKFLQLDTIKNNFKDINPLINREVNLKEDTVDVSSKHNGYHLRNKNEVLQLRRGSFSFHFLNGYRKFDELLNSFSEYWSSFNELTKETLTVIGFSVRYINVIEIDEENQPTHLIQLYPKQSNDRTILNFQNSIQFSYNESPKYIVNAVSTRINQNEINGVLLDISVSNKTSQEINKKTTLKKLFNPLQEIKNKAFFDSITARTLVKYMTK